MPSAEGKNQCYIYVFQVGSGYFDDYAVDTINLYCRHVVTSEDAGYVESTSFYWGDWEDAVYCSSECITC